MNKLILSIIVLTSGTIAMASGYSRVIYNCSDSMPDNAASINVMALSTSPPGGPITSWIEASVEKSWIGGVHSTGKVKVSAVQSGTKTTYSNANQKFELIVWKAETDKNNKVTRIDVSGRFVSTDKMSFSVDRRWVKCK